MTGLLALVLYATRNAHLLKSLLLGPLVCNKLLWKNSASPTNQWCLNVAYINYLRECGKMVVQYMYMSIEYIFRFWLGFHCFVLFLSLDIPGSISTNSIGHTFSISFTLSTSAPVCPATIKWSILPHLWEPRRIFIGKFLLNTLIQKCTKLLITLRFVYLFFRLW